MKVYQNHSLKAYNTFGLAVKARQFVSVTTADELNEVLQQVYAHELFILGGGSNLLFTKDIPLTVLHIHIKGKEILHETPKKVRVKVNAGENWHEFVQWCIRQDFGGVENLSLIPGNVGTSPIQNIGAYGVELCDVFVECEAIHIQTLERKVFDKKTCNFGYRNSIFKNEAKGQYIITSVTVELTKKKHQLHTGYGAILGELKKRNIVDPGIKDIADAVIAIRQKKLPDPKVLGNSGSFFKNPILPLAQFEKIRQKHPEIPHYKVSEKEVKVPAGWLIDQTGLKGYRKGDAGVHKNQALVLVNYGKATGEEIWMLAQKIQQVVAEKFSITLMPEVNVI